MRATIILCDFAEQDQPAGKVHILGAGWSVTGPQPSQHSVVVLIKVGWTEANHREHFTLRLTDADGNVVKVPSPAGTQALEFTGDLEVGRPPGIPEGSEIDASFVIGLQPLPLPGGQRYTWRLAIGTNEAASESFFVRPLPPHAEPPQASGNAGSS
jgi:hypothetical protein